MTAQAREVYIDHNENLDLCQVLGLGGVINSGQTWNNFFYGQATAADNLTATPNATQATALPLTAPLNRITTSASGSGVLLPPAIRGMEIVVSNDGNNTITVFASGSDTINGTAGATGVSLANTASLNPSLFFCFSNGVWRNR